MLALATIGFASVSSAAIITCTPADGTTNVVTNNIQESSPSIYNCAGRDAGAGNEIFAIAVRLSGSFNDEVEGDLHQVTFSGLASINGATHSITTNQADLSGDNGGFNSGVALPFGPAQILASGSTVAITWDFNGFNVPTNATVTVRLETSERPIQIGEVPEPSTFMLLGTALTGLGVAARRRRKA